VTLAASDATSGLLSTQYRVDGGAWQAYANPVTVSGDGEHRVEFYSTDTAGNVEPLQAVSFRIDTTAPATEAFLSGPLGGGGWYTGLVVVTLVAADASSGVDLTEFRVDGGSWQAYAEPVEVAGDGTHTVEYRSTDVAGVDEGSQSVVFDVDATPPATVAVPVGTVGDNQWFTGPVAVALVTVDAGSGVAVAEYRLDDSPWQAFTAPITVTGDGVHVLGYRATDVAGNVEPLGRTYVSIDTTAPATTPSLLGQRPADVYTSHVVVELGASDATSGVSFTEVRVDGGAWQPYTGAFRVTADGAHTVEYRSTDQAGNQEAVKSMTFRIDTSLLSPSGPVGPWLLVLLIAVTAGFLVLGFLLLRKRKKPEATGPPTEEKQ